MSRILVSGRSCPSANFFGRVRVYRSCLTENAPPLPGLTGGGWGGCPLRHGGRVRGCSPGGAPSRRADFETRRTVMSAAIATPLRFGSPAKKRSFLQSEKIVYHFFVPNGNRKALRCGRTSSSIKNVTSEGKTRAGDPVIYRGTRLTALPNPICPGRQDRQGARSAEKKGERVPPGVSPPKKTGLSGA